MTDPSGSKSPKPCPMPVATDGGERRVTEALDLPVIARVIQVDFAQVPACYALPIRRRKPLARRERHRYWLGVALCQPLDLEHHLAAHHESDRFEREASKREATLPIRGVVVPAPGQEPAAAIGARVDDELPG